MSTRFPPYPAYKPSNVPWLGDIPAHWEVMRLKFVAPFSFARLDEKPEDLIYVGLENIESKTGRLLLDAPIENVESTVNLFNAGDVLFGKLRPYLAKVALPNFRGVCTTEILALQPTNETDARFLFYKLLSDGFINLIDSFTFGSKMPRASSEQIGNVKIGLPPLPEQRAIAAFLDRETARLDTLIAKKQQLIERLHEKRTALISRVVTKGLDANARMKDSGVAWLGEVPEHWEMQFVKRHFDIELGRMLDSSKQPEDGEMKPYLRAANIHWDKIYLDDLNEMKFTTSQQERYRIRKGDLLVTEGGVTVGRSAIWQDELDEMYYQNSLNRARPKNNFPIRFLYYWMYFLKVKGFIDLVAEKSTFGHLTKEKLQVVLMPNLLPDEANEIVARLDQECVKIDTLVAKIQDAIERLREYRGALIAAAVTGKMDVREM